MGPDIDRLGAEERRIVLDFARRSTGLSPQAQAAVAARIAVSLRGKFPEASAIPDDVEFVRVLASAIEADSRGIADPIDTAVAAAARPLAQPHEISGRHYLLSRLDDLASAGVIDRSAAERVRIKISMELAEIDAARARVREATVKTAVPAPPPPPAGPSLTERFAAATRTFATEQTPSLLLYIGAFMVVVAAFIFVSVSGEQISDLVKLVLMLVGTTSFLAAGIICHRFPRVLPAGRTFLVIGALIAPLDVVAYYVLVAHASPIDAPTLWMLGSFVCAALYVALRVGGYGVGYSYLFYAAALSGVLGVEAQMRLPASWGAVPIAAIAVVFEAIRGRVPGVIATLIDPLPRMSMIVAAGAGAALTIPLTSSAALDRAALPAGVALLTIYYFLRAPAGGRWERLLATAGPGATVLGAAYSAGASRDVLGLVTVLVGSAYLAPELTRAMAVEVAARAPWASTNLTRLGALLVVGGLIPLEAFARAPWVGAAAFAAFSIVAARLSLATVRDGPSRVVLRVPGHYILGAACVGTVVTYRFVLAATGLVPLADTQLATLARAYAPLSFVAWGGVAALAGRGPHALVATVAAAALAVAVSVGSYADAPAHTVINALMAIGAAVAGVRLVAPRILWIASVPAMLAALGASRWVSSPVEFTPLIALVPAFIAGAVAYFGFAREVRAALLQIAAASAIVAAGIGFALSPLPRPWDAGVWWTTMGAIASAGAFAWLEAWRRRSPDIAIAAALSIPVLIDMFILTRGPTIPEPLTIPFAAYAFAAAWVTARSKMPELRRFGPAFEYAGATLLLAATVVRARDFATLLAAVAIALALLVTAARLARAPLSRVALAGLAYLALTHLYEDPRIDEILIAAGSLLIALCVASQRPALRLHVPDRSATELVAGVLIVLPTAVVTFLAPGEGHFDIPIPLLLIIELAALYAVAVVWHRRALLRLLIAVSAVAALEFVALREFGEWYAALLGSAMLNAAFAITRRWPDARALREHGILSVVGVAVLFLPSLGHSFRDPSFAVVSQILAGAVGVAIAGGLLGEVWITRAALAVVALESVVVMREPRELQLPAVLAGAALIVMGVAFARFRRRGLPASFSVAFDLIGVVLYLAPTFLLTSGAAAATQHAILMTQLVALLLLALGFRRRWLVVPAIAMIGTEAVRGILEIVNRIPSFATFAIAGALLLAIGFLLLLKRELFERWRRHFMHWWVAWLGSSS